MEISYPVYLYVIAVGIVAAGVTGSMWAMATGESPRFGLLLEPSAIAPVRALVVVAYAPLLILLTAWRFVGSPILGMLLVAASLGWSFLQGVFILTQFFGVT
ncbi:MAG TPA: hypothetical protein VJ019_10050 [Aestuariivirga sp.]|nr:hypothetical protein [Aestuariivirga sp.]